MALLTTTTDVSGITPDEYGSLIVEPVIAECIAFDPAVATVVRTSSTNFHIPILRDDAGAAWVNEGAEIAEDDPTLDELTVTPTKVAGLTLVSRELATDSSPAAQQIVGTGLARAIIAQVDAAFLGNLASPAPKGLEAQTGFIPVDIGTAITSLDPFADAISKAEEEGANITAFIVSPSDALVIAKLKEETGSNKNLLEDARTVYGRPLKVNRKATAGTAWAVDSSRIITVLREDTTVAISGDAYFSSDRIAVRATMRIGFGFPSPSTLVKLTITE